MELRFSEKKATQAAALFLNLSGGRLNYLVLIKDLYLADRQALIHWCRAVTNDKFYSMKLGPVLSHTLNLIHDQPSPEDESYWRQHISPPSEYFVELRKDPGTDQLSQAEEGLIQSVFNSYREYQEKPFDFARHLRKILPEWERITEGRSPIAIRAILMASQRPTDEIDEIESEINSVNFIHSVFGQHQAIHIKERCRSEWGL